jgi:predicted  nucleic acid-binding Zn-ribbon protein
MKTIKWLVIAVLAALSVYLLDQYLKARAEGKAYREKAEATEQALAATLGRVSALTSEIAQRDRRIEGLEEIIVQNVSTIRALQGQLEDAQAAEPEQPELESEPLVVNLRFQIKTLTNMFTLAQSTITTQSQEIEELRGKCAALQAIGAEWKGRTTESTHCVLHLRVWSSGPREASCSGSCWPRVA